MKQTKVKWARSVEGFASSQCGRFSISPNYEGTTRPQSYKAWDHERGKTIGGTADTQSQMKQEIEDYLERIANR